MLPVVLATDNTLFSQGSSIKPALHGPIALLSLQKPSGIPQT